LLVPCVDICLSSFQLESLMVRIKLKDFRARVSLNFGSLGHDQENSN
jgi:hypothetical protein